MMNDKCGDKMKNDKCSDKVTNDKCGDKMTNDKFGEGITNDKWKKTWKLQWLSVEGKWLYGVQKQRRADQGHPQELHMAEQGQ